MSTTHQQEVRVTQAPVGQPIRPPSAARIRLLQVADELFYAEGITTTGIDRIIAEAQVTKATFYKQYGSKDALILEYIVGRDRQVRRAMEGLLVGGTGPLPVLEGIVEAVVADTARPDFRGDPFLNAAIEFADPAHPVRVAVTDHRDWFTGFLEDRFRSLGHARPGAAADMFSLLRDGAVCGSYAGDEVAATSAFVRATGRLLEEASAG